MVRAAALLGGRLRKVRRWQQRAELLFNEGLELSDDAVRSTAVHLVDNEKTKMTALWDVAKAQGAHDDQCPGDQCPDERCLDVAGLDEAGLLAEEVAARIETLRRQLSPRRADTPAIKTALFRAVVREMELAHKGRNLAPRTLKEYAGIALTWRVADLVQPEALTEVHRNLARHGVEEPMTPVGDGPYPLPASASSSLTA